MAETSVRIPGCPRSSPVQQPPIHVLREPRMIPGPKTRHFGIITQVYPPDPAAVGQHLADVADELGRMGHRVSVYTADRGYDDPTARYPRFERQGNVNILRLPLASFGKGSIALRLLGGASLVAQASLAAALDPRLTDLLLSTIPHFVGVAGLGIKAIRRIPFHYWLMDFNPDQIVALGKISSTSPAVKVFDLLNRGILRHAATITALDEVMAHRFGTKAKNGCPIAVQSPWSFQNQNKPIDHLSNTFRTRFGLTSERIIMYAGNHSAVHPLETLVEAIRRRRDSDLRYFFIGGGVGKANLELWFNEEQPRNVTLLPYQQREQVESMLCAADVHVVSVGNNTVGIVHPSKIYAALAAGRPILVIGPKASPAARLVQEHGVGWHVEHGDVNGLVGALDDIERMSADELSEWKQRAVELSNASFAKQSEVRRFCERIVGFQGR